MLETMCIRQIYVRNESPEPSISLTLARALRPVYSLRYQSPRTIQSPNIHSPRVSNAQCDLWYAYDGSRYVFAIGFWIGDLLASGALELLAYVFAWVISYWLSKNPLICGVVSGSVAGIYQGATIVVLYIGVALFSAFIFWVDRQERLWKTNYHSQFSLEAAGLC